MLAGVISDLEDKLTAAMAEKDEEKKVVKDGIVNVSKQTHQSLPST